MEPKDRYEQETVSHSGLLSLDKSPKTYRSYKNREEKSTSSMNLGSAIHCRVLEPDEYLNRYYVSEFELPSGKNALFIEELFRTRPQNGDIFTDIIDISQATYEEQWVNNAHKVSKLKGDPKKAWDSFQGDTSTANKLQEYWTYLEAADGKFKLNISDEVIAQNCKANLKTHKVASKLLFGEVEAYNELDITWVKKGFKFKMRSIIDRLIVDRENKELLVVDLKTTSYNVFKFLSSYEKYKYYRQMALYMKTVEWYAKNILKIDLSGWVILPYIVATQTSGHNQCAVYVSSVNDIYRGTNENDTSLQNMEWHFNNDLWEYPRNYYEGDGLITLNLDE